jgi:O-antigen/teichoic acid export membrane protein
VRDVGTVLAGQTSRLVAATGSGLLIAGIAGPTARGVLAAVMAVAGLIAIPLSLGINGASTYFLGSQEWTPKRNLGLMLLLGVVAVPLALAAGLVVRELRLAALGQAGPTEMAALVAATVGQLLTAGLGGIMFGLKRFRMYAIASFAQPVTTLALFAMLELAGAGHVVSALFSGIVGLAAPFLVAFVVMMFQFGLGLPTRRMFRELLGYGGMSLGANILNQANLRLDVAIMTVFASAEVIGLYAFAVQIAEAVWLIPTSVGSVVFPSVAGDRERDPSWTARVSGVTVLACLVAYAAATAAAWLLTGFVLPAYAGSMVPLLLLAPGTIVMAMGRVVVNDWYGRGRPGVVLAAAGAAFAVTVALGVWLIPQFGGAGAAVVSSVAYATYALTAAVWWTRTYGVRLGSLAVARREDLARLFGAVRSAVASR